MERRSKLHAGAGARTLGFAAMLAAPIVSGCASFAPPTFGEIELSAHTETFVRFVAVGDVGEFDSNARRSLACHSRRLCKQRGGCDFSVLLGDNLYPAGIENPKDECRLKAVVSAYPGQQRALVLGNHDYGKVFPSSERAAAELSFIAAHEKDGMRGRYNFYVGQAGPAFFTAIDTNLLVRDGSYTRDPAVRRFITNSTPPSRPWHIVLGHHPYWSVGQHGNAGSYRDGGSSLWRGSSFRNYMRDYVLGRADLYLSGHDHNLQFFGQLEREDTAGLVVGSSSKCTHPKRMRRSHQPDVASFGFGFAIVEVHVASLVLLLVDERGEPMWRATRTKAAPKWDIKLVGEPRSRDEPCEYPVTACDDGVDATIAETMAICDASL